MKRTSQFGRTMLETISILALIGVLGVTGIYMYKKGMDSVRADSVVKDVLIRAEQKNANDNLNDMGTKKNVFVPEYKKGTGDASEYRTKGSYGYSYEITYSAAHAVVVKTNDTIITPGACNAIKSKLMTYDTKKSPRVVCAVQNPLQGNDIVRNCVNDATDIISNGCPDENIDNLYFVVAFGQSVERRAPLPRAEISPNREEGNCPVGTSKDGTGESIGENGCRCLHPSAHWTGSHCVICDENEVWNSVSKECKVNCPAGSSVLGTGDVTSNSSCQCDEPNTRWYINSCLLPCAVGTSINGEGGEVSDGCKCQYAGHYWNSVERNCQPCPVGSSIEGLGGVVSGMNFCRCNGVGETWSMKTQRCIVGCSGDKVLNSDETACVCPMNTIEKEDNENLCVQCNDNDDCPEDFICQNNYCEEEEIDCAHGICQSCVIVGGKYQRANLPSGTDCETAGVQGKCDGNGICYPLIRNTCKSIGACPSGEFCNYGGTFESGAQQNGYFGKTPNVCQKVNAKKYIYKDQETNEDIVFYYNSKKDLKSWCRAADNSSNCTWGYLAYYGAKDWCKSIGKRLLTNEEFKKYETVLKSFLPKTIGGYSYWVDGGAYDPNSSSAYSGRLDGYAQTGGVVCLDP